MKSTIITAVLLAIFLFFALQQGNGPLVILFLPFYLVMAIYHVVRMMQKVDQRRSRGVQLVAWSAAALLGSAVHLYRSSTSRAEADSAARMVLDYRQRTGSYPETLADVGLDPRSSMSSRRLRYTVRDGTPALSYPATFMPLTMLEYDFETRHWRRNAH